MISDGFENHITSYTITYSGATIPVIFVAGVLLLQLRLVKMGCAGMRSKYPPHIAIPLTVTVIAATVLGSGTILDPLTIGCFFFVLVSHQ